ncbi:unnamed protein product [Urochloa humidicola]
MIEGSLIDCQVSNWLGEEVLFCPMKHVEIEMRPADRSVEAGTTRTPPHRPVCVPRSRHHDALNRHTPIPALCSFFYLQDLVIFQSREGPFSPSLDLFLQMQLAYEVFVQMPHRYMVLVSG